MPDNIHLNLSYRETSSDVLLTSDYKKPANAKIPKKQSNNQRRKLFIDSIAVELFDRTQAGINTNYKA